MCVCMCVGCMGVIYNPSVCIMDQGNFGELAFSYVAIGDQNLCIVGAFVLIYMGKLLIW